jgi:hypothetical protein
MLQLRKTSAVSQTREKGRGKRESGDQKKSSEHDLKRPKLEKVDNISGGHGSWDRDEFSGMMRERGGDRA